MLTYASASQGMLLHMNTLLAKAGEQAASNAAHRDLPPPLPPQSVTQHQSDLMLHPHTPQPPQPCAPHMSSSSPQQLGTSAIAEGGGSGGGAEGGVAPAARRAAEVGGVSRSGGEGGQAAAGGSGVCGVGVVLQVAS
jgi:hypothetical protein